MFSAGIQFMNKWFLHRPLITERVQLLDYVCVLALCVGCVSLCVVFLVCFYMFVCFWNKK